MKGKLINYIIVGGILYFLYNKLKNKVPESTQIPDQAPETKLISLPVSKPKSSKPAKQIEVVKLPFEPGNNIIPKLPYKNVQIFDPTYKKVLGTTREARFILPVGTAKNLLKVEAIIYTGAYKLPTKIIGYTEPKYWTKK